MRSRPPVRGSAPPLDDLVAIPTSPLPPTLRKEAPWGVPFLTILSEGGGQAPGGQKKTLLAGKKLLVAPGPGRMVVDVS